MGVPHQSQRAVGVLDQGREGFDPVPVVRVDQPAADFQRGTMDVPADDAVEAAHPGRF